MTKFFRFPFPLSYSITLHVFDLVHTNIWRLESPFNVASFEGHRYFLTVIDDPINVTYFLHDLLGYSL